MEDQTQLAGSMDGCCSKGQSKATHSFEMVAKGSQDMLGPQFKDPDVEGSANKHALWLGRHSWATRSDQQKLAVAILAEGSAKKVS